MWWSQNNSWQFKKKGKRKQIWRIKLEFNYDKIEENSCYQESYLLWVDSNVNNKENKSYQDMIKKIDNIHLSIFTDINKCISNLIKIEFDKTFIMVSGSLSSDFFNKLEENLDKKIVMSQIIIFTS